VNQSVDAMGFHTALDACFSIHQLNHAHWTVESGGTSIIGTPALGLSEELVAAPIRPSSRTEA
jgi:enoyl-CoA hydratase